MPRTTQATTVSLKQQVVETACPQEGYDNYMRTLQDINAIADKFAEEHSHHVRPLIALFTNAKFRAKSSCMQKWTLLKTVNARLTSLVEKAFLDHIAATFGSAGAFAMPNGAKAEEKTAVLYLWLPTLLKDKQDGNFQRRFEQCFSKAPQKWVSQKKTLAKRLTKLGFDSWTEAAQRDLLQQVSNVKLSRFDVARGARRAQSILMLPLFERAGLQLLFTNLRKDNVWIKTAGKRKRTDTDETEIRAQPSKKAKLIELDLDDNIIGDILLDVEVESPATPTQSPRHSPISPVEQPIIKAAVQEEPLHIFRFHFEESVTPPRTQGIVDMTANYSHWNTTWSFYEEDVQSQDLFLSPGYTI